MQTFLRNICYFLFFCFSFFLLLFFVFDYISDKELAQFDCGEKITTLVAGDSHTQLAINDNLLPYAKNISQSQEALFFTYYKLEPILKNNPGLKKVYLGLAYHSFSGGYDDISYGNEAKDVAARYFYILPVGKKTEILKRNMWDFPFLFREITWYGIETSFNDIQSSPFMGGYNNNFTDLKVDPIIVKQRINRHFYKGNELYQFSNLQKKYLRKIQTMCEELRVDLIIVNTPLSPVYRHLIPGEYIKAYEETVQDLDLQLLDLSQIPLNEHRYTPDGDHVTRSGAVLTTRILDQFHKAQEIK